VVIAIIAILASILFPVFARAREQARKAACLSNLRQLGMAMQMYSQDYDEMLVPQQIYTPGDTVNSRSWGFCIAPYIKSSQMMVCPNKAAVSTPRAGQYDTNYGYNRTPQPTVALAMTSLTISNYANLAMGGSYLITGGLTAASGGVLPTVLRHSNVADASGTIMAGDSVAWTSGSSAKGSKYWGNGVPYIQWKPTTPPIGVSATYYADPRHSEGANFVFVDGHAKWLKTTLKVENFTSDVD
jgi:prepilin-type processing-associated H-X9-DG protein